VRSFDHDDSLRSAARHATRRSGVRIEEKFDECDDMRVSNPGL